MFRGLYLFDGENLDVAQELSAPKPQSLSHLLQENLFLQIVCVCGLPAEPQGQCHWWGQCCGGDSVSSGDSVSGGHRPPLCWVGAPAAGGEAAAPLCWVT